MEMRRHSVIAVPGFNEITSFSRPIGKRRISISGSRTGNGKRKTSLPVNTSRSRRSSSAGIAHRASVANPILSADQIASLTAIANISRRRQFSVEDNDIHDIIELEELDDDLGELSVSDLPPRDGRRRSSVVGVKENSPQNEEKKQKEPSAIEKKKAFTNFVCETLKTVFDLVLVNDEIDVNIDNIFPLMKALELDTKDETILDMVRTSCMETLGDIDEIEFDKAVLEQRKRAVGEEFEEDLKSAFTLIDADEDGYITCADLYNFMMGLGDMLTDEELNDIIKIADADKDGQISYKDFKIFLIGETEEEQPNEQEVTSEEHEQETSEQSVEATEQNKEELPEGEITHGNPSADVKTEEKTEGKIIADDQEEKEKSLLKRKRSILWGYTATKRDSIKEPVESTVIETKDNTEETMDEMSIDETTCQNPSKDDDGICKSETHNVESEHTVSDEKGNNDNAVNDDIDDEDDDVDDEDDDDDDDDNDDDESRDTVDESDDARSVISVSVKQLDSIKEEADTNSTHAQSDTFSQYTDISSVHRPNYSRRRPVSGQPTSSRPTSGRPTSGRLTLSRPNSGLSSEDFPSDLGVYISEDDEEVVEHFDRESVSSKCPSAKHRISSARKRFGQSDDTSFEIEGDVTRDEERFDSRQSISRQTIDSDILNKDTEQRIGNLGNDEHRYQTTHSYCEVGSNDVNKIDVKSITELSSDDSTPRTPKTTSRPVSSMTDKKPKFQRTRSAGRLKTIKQIESHMLRRQSTAPQLNREALRIANETMDWEKRSRNVNGFTCAHIDIDLSCQKSESPNAKFFRPNSSPRIRRPKTAMTYNEVSRKAIADNMNKHESVFTKYDSGIDSPDTDDDRNVTVVDLSRYFSKNTGYPEHPDQSLHHHGYKSVLPLARVMDAYNKKHNDGKEIQLNSISRRLERRDIPQCWNDIDSPRRNVNQTLVTHSPRQRPKTSLGIRHSTIPDVSHERDSDIDMSGAGLGIINLKLPFQTNNHTRYKRTSPFIRNSVEKNWHM